MGEALKIGITGLPGAGKTYCLLKVIEMLEADGLKVGGMITEPIVKRNRREGFYVMTGRRRRSGCSRPARSHPRRWSAGSAWTSAPSRKSG